MEKPLKKALEEIIKDTINGFEYGKFEPKRIILYNSDKKVKSDDKAEILSYTENRFLNQQFVIDRRINIEAIHNYVPQKDKQEGDYPIDVGDWLKSIHSRPTRSKVS